MIHSDCCDEPLEFYDIHRTKEQTKGIYQCPKCWGKYLK